MTRWFATASRCSKTLSNRRWDQRIADLGPTATPREILETYFGEALPTHDRSRRFHIVFTAYAALAITDPALARTPFVDGPRRIQATITDLLATGQAAGELDAAIDPERERNASSLLSTDWDPAYSSACTQRTPRTV